MPETARYGVEPKAATEALRVLMRHTYGRDPFSNVQRRRKAVYFAHAQPVYGTEEEKADLARISQHFSGYTIVNPADIKEYHIRDMDFYLGVVGKCDALVFTRSGVL
ncbi:MAG: hypothetical protein KGI04_03925 [Candidatus Micrarchaeota archaeon]|nr:hypothetical protein [Candidatus Micrarchaeota archaeon]